MSGIENDEEFYDICIIITKSQNGRNCCNLFNCKPNNLASKDFKSNWKVRKAKFLL